MDLLEWLEQLQAICNGDTGQLSSRALLTGFSIFQYRFGSPDYPEASPRLLREAFRKTSQAKSTTLSKTCFN